MYELESWLLVALSSFQVTWSSFLGFIIYRSNSIKSETILLVALEVSKFVRKLMRSFLATSIGGSYVLVLEKAVDGFVIWLLWTRPLMDYTDDCKSQVLATFTEERLPRSILPGAGIQ